MKGGFLSTFLALVFKSSGKKNSFQRELRIPSLTSSNPKYGNKLPVMYTNDAEAAQRWVDTHVPRDDRPIAIGWDMESAPDLPWRKSTYTGPSTVQISVVDAALVLHIAQDDTGPQVENLPFVNHLLSDASILKVGVGLDQDMLDLYQWQQTQCQSLFNNGGIQQVSGRLDIGGIGGSVGGTKSLKALAEEICGIDLPKQRKLAMSNWAASPQLTTQQVAYAARDAWVAAAVLDELSIRDPGQFSTEVLANQVLENELPIGQLLKKAQARKAAKEKLKVLLTNDNGEKIQRNSLAKSQQDGLLELDDTIRKLAPPQPIRFDLT